MIKRISYVILFIIMNSCVQDLPISSSSQPSNLNNEDIQWFYDIDSQELLIQIDVNNIGKDIINHIYRYGSSSLKLN